VFNACVCVCVSCRWSIAEGRPKQTVLLPDCSLTSLAVPVIDTGIDVFVTGEASHEHSASPFRLLDLVTNTVKADVDLSGSQFGQVRSEDSLPFFTCEQSRRTMQRGIHEFSVRGALSSLDWRAAYCRPGPRCVL
jgi:hypothetical protein